MKKKKMYIVSIREIEPYNYLEIEAYSKTEARKKARKILRESPEYSFMEIDDIEEA